jgi:hypothetical protein
MNACHPGKVNCQSWLCLLLTLAMVWELAGPGLSSARFFAYSGIGSNDGCELDSFSEPSIAVAIIRTEADRLFNERVVAPDANAQALEHLRQEIQDLKTDVNRKLLAVYSERGLGIEFLDRYLEFLREAPENPWVVSWAAYALVQAHRCGRSGEVVEALQHVILTHPEWKISRGLRAALEQWGPADCSLVEAPPQ